MKLEGFLNTRVAGYAAIALIGAVVLYVVTKKLGDAAEAALDAVNPTKDTNLAYTGAGGTANKAASGNPGDIAKAAVVSPIGALLGVLTGPGEDSLGGRLYTLFNGQYDPNARTPTYVPRKLDVREQASVYAP